MFAVSFRFSFNAYMQLFYLLCVFRVVLLIFSFVRNMYNDFKHVNDVDRVLRDKNREIEIFIEKKVRQKVLKRIIFSDTIALELEIQSMNVLTYAHFVWGWSKRSVENT